MAGGCFAKNHIELQLTVSETSVTGTLYQYLDTANYIRKDIEGTYHKDSRFFTMQESAAISYKIPKTCAICIKNYRLIYSKKGTIETLTGTWAGNVMGSGRPCQPGTIVLSRTTKAVFEEPPQIKVDTGDIRLDFYDNGDIDGDSITVLINKNVVVSHQKLGVNPITTFVKVDASKPFQLVEIIAENLGSIPPNTALLLITAGKKRYRLFFSTTEQKNARVLFVYSAEAGSDSNN